jgi:hypothetical protein
VDRVFGTVVVLAASLAAPLAVASGAMPAAQQNALVETYCAVCHTDASRNGGLSLQHFDATRLWAGFDRSLPEPEKLRRGKA